MRPRKKVKLADIARISGVSVVTVSNALAGRGGVSDEMRAKIVACAKELGYEREDKKTEQRAETLYLAVLAGEENADLLRPSDLFMECLLNAGGDSSVILSTGVVREQAGLHVPDICWLTDRGNIVRCDGILVRGDLAEKSLRALADFYKVPVIGYGFVNPRVSLDYVMDDGFRGMRCAVRHLAELGHRELVYISQEIGRDRLLVDRLLGFWNAMYEYGLIDPAEIPELMRDPEYGQDLLLHRIREGRIPDAVVCSSDETAFLVTRLLNQHGLRVPDDVSVTGYRVAVSGETADQPFSSCVVRLDIHAMKCLDLLRKRITKGGSPDGIRPLENEFACGRSTVARQN